MENRQIHYKSVRCLCIFSLKMCFGLANTVDPHDRFISVFTVQKCSFSKALTVSPVNQVVRNTRNDNDKTIVLELYFNCCSFSRNIIITHEPVSCVRVPLAEH